MMESSVEDLLDRCSSVDEMEESPEENEKWGQSSVYLCLYGPQLTKKVRDT